MEAAMSLRLGNRFEDRIEQEARVSQAERDEIRETRLEPPSIPPALSASEPRKREVRSSQMLKYLFYMLKMLIKKRWGQEFQFLG